MPFALLLVASLWATDAYLADAAPSPARALVTGVIAALPFLCRTAGVVVPVAACLAIVRAKRPVAPFVVGAAVAMAPWILWMLRGIGQLATSPIVGYQQDYLGHWSAGYFGYPAGSRVALAAWGFGADLVKACTAVGDFLSGGFDVLHFFANAGTGRFIAPVGLGDVLFNFLDESFQCLEFLHGSSLWLKGKMLQRGGRGVNSVILRASTSVPQRYPGGAVAW